MSIICLWSLSSSHVPFKKPFQLYNLKLSEGGVCLKQSKSIFVTGHICHYLHFIVFCIVNARFSLCGSLYAERSLSLVSHRGFHKAASECLVTVVKLMVIVDPFWRKVFLLCERQFGFSHEAESYKYRMTLQKHVKMKAAVINFRK